MLRIEQALKELHALERELGKTGVKVEITDGGGKTVAKMEILTYYRREAYLQTDGRVHWRNQYAKTGQAVAGGCPVPEYRVRLITMLAQDFKKQADEKREQWEELCDGDTIPMPPELQAKVDGFENRSRLLTGLLSGNEPPILNKKDYQLLEHIDKQDETNYLGENELKRLTELGVAERRYYMDTFHDIPTERGRKAMGYAANVTEWEEPQW